MLTCPTGQTAYLETCVMCKTIFKYNFLVTYYYSLERHVSVTSLTILRVLYSENKEKEKDQRRVLRGVNTLLLNVIKNWCIACILVVDTMRMVTRVTETSQ